LQILVQCTSGTRIAAPLGEAQNLHQAHAAVKRDGDDVAWFHRMARRFLAHAVDADMAAFNQRGGAGAGLHHPRVPQPFVETLLLQSRSLSGG